MYFDNVLEYLKAMEEADQSSISLLYLYLVVVQIDISNIENQNYQCELVVCSKNENLIGLIGFLLMVKSYCTAFDEL